MSVIGVLVFVATWWALPRPPGSARGRITESSVDSTSRPTPSGVSWVERPLHRGVVCALGLSAVANAAGGIVLGVVGLGAGVGMSWWLGRLEPPSIARRSEQVRNDLPVAVDLLAACTLAGRPLDQSIEVVSRAVGGPLGSRLGVGSSRLRLGADPLTEWSELARDPLLAPLARTMARSLASGAPLVDGLTRLAEDRRRERRTETQTKARSVGVRCAGPLALCFLPAFMLIGIVPTIAGAFSRLVL